MTATLDRPHVWLPGADGPPLLLLHGTGGDEHDLLPLREHLAPNAPTLSVRGTVMENGMPRFFRRLREGVFDEDDLHARVDELATFLQSAEQHYGVAAGSWLAVGFSNGANIASATLLQRPHAFSGAVLMAAMAPFHDPPQGVDLTGKRVAVVNGEHDPMATRNETERLVGQLRERGAAVTVLAHRGGHTVDPRSLPRIERFLREAR
ncbi:alpha/beta hydrolase [Saccharopolyspora sp. K220]|uniref:alpha/beta hydrolase n=1 Tax=Saccharopolyspora soli TaxID=2926618 RepID=UPI001F5AB619|nr:alpha/beta hydrolase [Saccharopolyspora soli]MCI2422555.1 alpha/beta hydrolase [Saccharopolyspora soli]